jgi:hypothetical protein
VRKCFQKMDISIFDTEMTLVRLGFCNVNITNIVKYFIEQPRQLN